MQYVVLHHTEVAEPHFDFLVEITPGADLAAWRLPAWPIESEADATRLKDHRRFYLTYEGEIPSHRGRVDRVGGGECSMEISDNDVLKFTIHSGGPAGTILLRKINGDVWRVSA